MHSQSLVPFSEWSKLRHQQRKWHRQPTNWALIGTFTAIMIGAAATLLALGADQISAPFPGKERIVPCDHCRK